MDAEDLAEAAQAGKTIVLAPSYRRAGAKRRTNTERLAAVAGPSSSSTSSPLNASGQSIGHRLLRVMGWMPGNTVGATAPSETKKRVFGPKLPLDARVQRHERAGRAGRKMYHSVAKTDRKGLGFPLESGSARSPVGRAGQVNLFSPCGEEYDTVLGDAAGSGVEISEPEDLSFTRASRPEPPPVQYPDLRVPPDFRGTHRFVADTLAVDPAFARLASARAHLDAIARRAAALGEPRLPGPPRQLQPQSRPARVDAPRQSLLSDSDKKRLAASLESAFKRGSGERAELKCIGESSTKAASWRQQFKAAGDARKQARFDAFLASVATGGGEPTLGGSELTDWQRRNEQREFAAIYREKVGVGQRKAGPSGAESHARLRMYGRLTREVKPWVPERLLCRRFKIPDPYKNTPRPSTTEPSTDAQRRYRETVGIVSRSVGVRAAASGFIPAKCAVDSGGTLTSGGGWAGSEKKTIKAQGEAPKESCEESEDEMWEETKPPMDLFKAIFAPGESSGTENESDSSSQSPSATLEPAKVKIGREIPTPGPTPLQPPPWLRVGAQVLYKGNTVVRIVAHHPEGAGFYFTCVKPDRSEVQTLERYLQPLRKVDTNEMEEPQRKIEPEADCSDTSDAAEDRLKKKKKKKKEKKKKHKKHKKSSSSSRRRKTKHKRRDVLA